MSPLQVSIIALKVIRRMYNKKEDENDSDTEVSDFGLHAKLFTALNGNALGCKARDLDMVMDLTDRAQRMMEDEDLTEDALRILALGNE